MYSWRLLTIINTSSNPLSLRWTEPTLHLPEDLFTNRQLAAELAVSLTQNAMLFFRRSAPNLNRLPWTFPFLWYYCGPFPLSRLFLSLSLPLSYASSKSITSCHSTIPNRPLLPTAPRVRPRDPPVSPLGKQFVRSPPGC